MGSPNAAFDQIKSILGKLDRSIDEARARRLSGPESEPEVMAGEEAPEPQRFGRARPLRSQGDDAMRFTLGG